ncbi:MAG: uncharacterized protein QOE60_2944, partial [Thermoleophilaceae bacterium]|nr:uncharacterized protein [Thermoleophilaceae bacterium]
DPVVDYDEATVRSALDRLGRRRWTTLASWSTARSVKYKHLLDQALGLSNPQLALLTVLMLRGPQTAGELRQRSERIHAFGSGEEVDATLAELAERELAEALPRRPGERGQRWAQRLAEPAADGPAAEAPIAEAPPSAPATAEPPPVAPTAGEPLPAAPDEGLALRVERLEGEVAALRQQLDSLRSDLGA